MRSLLWLAIFCFVAAVGYGEYDASRTMDIESGKPEIRAAVVAGDMVNGDYFEAHPGTGFFPIFLRVVWKPGNSEIRVIRIRVRGKIIDPGHPDYPFDSDCERATPDLSSIREDQYIVNNPSMEYYTNLSCFVWLKIDIARDIGSGLSSDAAFNDRLRSMKVEFYATGKIKCPPLAYIAWINSLAKHNFELIEKLFKRDWLA